MKKIVEEMQPVKREQICCDKCGRNIKSDWENCKKYVRTRVLHEERRANDGGSFAITWDPYDPYPKNITYDLCENCYKEFIKWIDKGEKQ